MITAFTPVSFSAFDVSIFLILAWACGLRRIAPDQLARHVEVGAVARAARDLVDAVGAERPRADDVKLRGLA